MTRLARIGASTALGDTASLRLRAAWLYFAHGLTQKQISERLGISRGTVIRLLAEARTRGEVQIWIEGSDTECTALGLRLEDAFGLDEAIVAPGTDEAAAPRSVGLALGRLLSETVGDGQTIGVGWGRSLTASLESLRPVRRTDTKVVSLVGGTVEARDSNPLEYSWRVADAFNAACYLFIAPAYVDSPETRVHLIEDCGLDALFRLGRALDIAVVGVGSLSTEGHSRAAEMITAKERAELKAAGAVGDLLCTFLDADGAAVDHPLNSRVMSVPLDDVARAGHVVVASGGASRAAAIRAAIRRIGANTLITDEGAAQALLG
ncbi:sugar-binding transcriptional regulator [Bauldia sp.]|uniref:sugar-binding transcriptional regulator n=1 Tax=Bauldia sp. TaxID=2575872 RepID=UPI003BABFA87